MIQYAAAFLVDHDRPGVLDRPVEPGDDSCELGDDAFGTHDDSVGVGDSGSAMSLVL
jgi:hypothetical protein